MLNSFKLFLWSKWSNPGQNHPTDEPLLPSKYEWRHIFFSPPSWSVVAHNILGSKMFEFAIYYFRIFYPVLLCMERSCLDLTIQSSAQMWHSLILCSGNESRLQVNDLWWWWGCPVLYHHCIVGPTWSSYFFSLDFVFSVSTFCLKINVVRLSVRNFGMDQNARWQNGNIVNNWKM